MPTRSKKTCDNSVLCPRTRSGPWQLPPHTDSRCRPRSRHFVATTRTDVSLYTTSCRPLFTGSAVDLPSTRLLPNRRLHYVVPNVCSLPLTNVKWPSIGLNSRRYRNQVSSLLTTVRAKPRSNSPPIHLKLSGSGLPRLGGANS